MKLRAKVITFLIVLTVSFLVADYAIHRFIIFPTYTVLEEAAAIENLERVRGAISNEIEHLDTYCKDWAFWDDTYEYIETIDSEFEQSNLESESFSSGGLNLIILVDASGSVVWEGGYDLENEKDITPEPILANPELKTFLLNFPDDGSLPYERGNRGIVLSSRGPLLVAARQILKSSRQGPSHGVLIMGRLLGDTSVERIRNQTRVDFSMDNIDISGKTRPLNGARVKVDKNAEYFFEKIDNDSMVVHTIIKDFLDRPAICIHVIFPREITKAGLMSIYYALVLILLVGGGAAVALGYFVNRVILKPLSGLEAVIQKVHDKSDYTVRADIYSKDEIGVLAHGFNLMLEKTENQTQQLDLFIEDLKSEIRKRSVIEERLKLANDELNKLARLDPLTLIPNRRHFNEVFAGEWKRQQRNGEVLSVIMCDIDGFKNFNDMYGHQCGDACLQQVAKSLENNARLPVDCVARYGGEEFIVLLPETPVENALLVAERMRASIEDLAIPHRASFNSDVVTLSLGVAGRVPDDEFSPDDLIHMADKALYLAKEQGRNRVVSLSF
ncbi:diguanylate cyclase domain-containing protein [Desulfosediminicola flagellatus]|uniref:sensor domain-containing diguanylate cyclase n=1 Tax=Desulfosediminicola flagellatus TaxID=2569541 RepID=UPI0010AB82B0|nr:diguanylate cyclase [Desulfosediminicola flagellatus]